jgi:hypothetical protein
MSNFHTKYLKGFASLVAFVGCIGCSPTINISGEAFIDSGSGAKKLALVDVVIVSEDKFLAHIKSEIPKAEERALDLAKSISESKALVDQSAMLQMQSMMSGMAYSSVLSENKKAVDVTIERMNKQSREVLGLMSGASPSYFNFNPDNVVASTKTDSNGRYQIKIDAGKKYVLIATKDELAWAVWIGPDKITKEISFTNQNLSGYGCDGCVFSKEITPKKLVGL